VTFELLISLFIQYGYWIVFAGILLDNAGLPLPGELLLLIFGALARTGHVHLGFGVLVAWLAAMSGDNVGYWLGRLGGERLLHAYCRVTLGSGKCLQKAVAFYHLRGRVAVVFGRFVMGVRAFLFPLAGSARMPYAQFFLFDSAGALVWAGLFVLAGYGLGWQVEGISEGYRTASTTLAGILGAGFAGYLLTKLARRWRHGPGSIRERMVSRVRKALRFREGTTPPVFIPMVSEISLAERNGTALSKSIKEPEIAGGSDGRTHP
jgi:membrane protein DedA with SNARE-associated domain